MTKDELVRQIADKTGITIKEAKNIVQITFDSITKSLSSGEKVKISGFGTFSTKKRGAFKTKNPMTGDILDIPEHIKPVFEPSKKLKETVTKSNAT